MNEITWEQLSIGQKAALQRVAKGVDAIGYYPFLLNAGLIATENNEELGFETGVILTDLGRAVLAQAASEKLSLLDTVEAEVTRAVTEVTTVELTDDDFAVDGKPTPQQEIWNWLTDSEKSHLRLFDREPHAVSVRPVAESLIQKGLVKWGWDSGHVLTPHGRVVLTSHPNTEQSVAPNDTAQPADASGADSWSDDGIGDLLAEAKSAYKKMNDTARNVLEHRTKQNEMAADTAKHNAAMYAAELIDALEQRNAELATTKAEAAQLRSALDQARQTFVTIQTYPDVEAYMYDEELVQGMIQQAVFGAQQAALNAGEG